MIEKLIATLLPVVIDTMINNDDEKAQEAVEFLNKVMKGEYVVISADAYDRYRDMADRCHKQKLEYAGE